jgi:Las17-binding protein actin regulator
VISFFSQPFCKKQLLIRHATEDGFYAEEDRVKAVDAPKGKQRVLKKIPEKVIQNAVGLAIFTTMRTGLWISGAGGSGVLIARKEDGEWSPPSGILLHTAGLGFLVGVDIYDCVVVINNRKALDAFTKIRATLGGEISAVAGPVGVGGVLENDGKWKQAKYVIPSISTRRTNLLPADLFSHTSNLEDSTQEFRSMGPSLSKERMKTHDFMGRQLESQIFWQEKSVIHHTKSRCSWRL